MKKIKINNRERDDLFFIVDTADYHKLYGYNWRIKPGSIDTIVTGGGNYALMAIRQILFPDLDSQTIVWHKNGNRFDFQWENLEFISRSEHMTRTNALRKKEAVS